MAESKVRRFSRLHLGIHWLVALPYIVLLASGAMLILEHLQWISPMPHQIWRAIHRIMGIAFVVIVVAVVLAMAVFEKGRVVARDLVSWFALDRDDCRWLLRLPGNTLSPRRCTMTAAGRFNAGQKIHGAFVLLAVAAFVVTGLLMVIKPGNLDVWLLHAWLSFAAAAFLAIHIFLAVVNPSTRPALSGIFTGRVPLDYVHAHHACTISDPPSGQSAHAMVSVKVLGLVSLVAVALGALWWLGPGGRMVHATLASPQENPIIMPGQLIAPHARQFIGGHCSGCHIDGGQAVDAACVQCHSSIRDVMIERTGYHGNLTGSCVSCHIEHQGKDADLRNFDPRSFNHALSRFPLAGAHASTACDNCHVGHAPTKGDRQYIGVKFSACTDCHANPHPDPTFLDCRRCHNEQTWTPIQRLLPHTEPARPS